MQRLELIPLKAPFWADSGHGQTLWAHFLSSPKLEYLGKQFEVDLPDGDRLFCFYRPGKSNIVVSLFHGLSGDVYADYMQRTALLCEQMGHSVVLVNHRGAGHGFDHAKNPYHSGRAEDVSAVLAKLYEMFPRKKQVSIGYSMSGNMLLCLLGGYRGEVKPDGAITINAPLNLASGSAILKQGLNRIYDLRFVNRLRKNIHTKYQRGIIDKQYHIPRWASVWDMDQIYTAPAGGFKDRDDYYKTCSSINYISYIDVPTYVLTAFDDPFIMARDYIDAPFSKSVQLHIESRGGHLGYLTQEKTPLGSNRWLDYYIHEALSALENTLS